MSDPVRWRSASSDAPGGARELLQAARPVPPIPPGVRAASADAVRSLAQTGAPSTVIGAASVKLGGSVVAALAAASLWWALSRSPSDAPIPAPAAAPIAAPEERPTPPAAPAAPAAPQVADAPATPPAPARPARPAPPRPPPPAAIEVVPAPPAPSPPAVDTLAREAALLESARSSLTTDPERALAEIARHRAEFPQGQLSAEREILGIDALGRLGRHEEARARAETFLATSPQIVLKERVERIMKRNQSVDSVKGL